jgi:hypothetical protein
MASDTLGKHGHGIGGETGKGRGGPYKPRIIYQVMGRDRGDRETGRMAGDAPRTTGRKASGTGTDSQPTAPQATARPQQPHNHLSAHRPPPHPSPPYPSPSAGQRPRKIPPLKRFLVKCKPEKELSLLAPPPPCLLFTGAPYPPYLNKPCFKYFWWFMFRAWRGLDCSGSPYGTLLPILCLLTAKWHTKCHIVQIWLGLLSLFYSDDMSTPCTCLEGCV